MFRKGFLGLVLVAGMLISQSVPGVRAATNCDQAQFVSDLTVPDGSSFAPGTAFTKSWRLMNMGTCTWNASYNLVWAGGDSIGAPAAVKLAVEVPPGQMVNLSVNLTAPSAAGHYTALFKISNASGVQFGIGDAGSDPFWADINVVQTSAVIYDFVANAPYAQWKSGAGLLPFPGTSGDSRGFAYSINNPHLEDDSIDPSPGLLTVPQNKLNGYIQAVYPEFQVQQGDRLQTLVNCEFGATGCYVTFRIDYLLPNGVQKTLWSWKEAYDKRFYRADLDLNSLAGQRVRFVFMLLSSGFASGDRALWGSPRILRSGPTQPPAPPATLTPLPPLPPSPTPIGQPPPTIAAGGCDRAGFVTDATVPDGTVFSPGAAFTKTWRLKNIGACTWTTSYKLVYYSGDPLGTSTAVNLPWNAAFDQTVDISVNMVAPAAPGKYRGYWILSNASGQFFGIGADASMPVWVEINVAGETPQENGYSFWRNVCSAEWKSGAGALPCSGIEGDSKGFILASNFSHLEDGTIGPAPSLLLAPENRYNGYIQGTFPALTVQPGDHFVSVVGCEYGYSCYVTFRLDYMTANGGVFNFWSWREQNDNKNYMTNVDLSPLAGRSVRFILTILATGTPAGDRVRWGAPAIVRSGAPPIVTPMPPTDTWPAYINPTYGFQFKYPPQSQRFFETANSILIQMPIAPGTNLREKYLQMTVSENISPCQSPLSSTSPPGSPTETVVINGISFFKQIGGDAGVGHLHQWVGYSTLKNNACFSMDFVLHSLGAGNFATPVPEFDKAAESAVFTQVMSTFNWVTSPITPIPPTAPPVVVPSPNITRLFMMDPLNGWAFGNSYVLRTSDSGVTWYNVTAPEISSIRNAFFQSSAKGWALTPDSIYRTTNGGSTWTRYSVPFNGGYIQFLDDLHGYVLSGELAGMQKHPVSLYQTSDGGATWTLMYANDPSQPNNTLPFSGHKNGMTFRDASSGWVGGEIPTPGFVYFYRTTDSGRTWAQQPLTLPTGYETATTSTTAPTFFGVNDAVLPVWMSTGVGARNLLLYVTHDGGNTWNPSPAFATSSYNSDFVSVRDAFSLSDSGRLQVTHDSAANWIQVTPNINLSGGIRQIDFVSTNTGWALNIDVNGNSSLYRTMDGGVTWAVLFGSIPPTAPPTLLPDLTITGMSIELQNPGCFTPADLLGVRVGIKNNGQAAAGSFVVRVNGLDQTVNGLGIGETTTVFFPGYTNPVTAMVDATGTVAESDENNNSRSEMVAVPTPPLPCVTPTETAQNIVNALNAKNFGAARNLMGQSFMLALWQSQGTSYTPDEAVQQLQANYIGANTVLVADPNKDLSVLLGGVNPYSTVGLDPSNSLALFVSGWGLDGKDEAILFVTRQADGTPYWHSVLIAKGGFVSTPGSISHEEFCADTRIPILIEQLTNSVNQSNGEMFAALVSPVHGTDVRLWAYDVAVNFSTTAAKNIFTSTEVYNWGSGPAGGTDYGTGTFSQVIQPKLQEVLNAPNLETYCDDLTKVFNLAHPWPYPDIRYYNLYKPASSEVFDFRTWLIGFEYVNNQPYLYAMVTIVWEP